MKLRIDLDFTFLETALLREVGGIKSRLRVLAVQ